MILLALLISAAMAGAGQAAPVSADPPLPAGLETGWYATIETGLGTMVARLFPEQAPQTVAHFAALAEGRLEFVDPLTGETAKRPYYDGLTVHRVQPMERFELGDPTATGRGAPLVYVPLERGPRGFAKPYRLGMTSSGRGRISGALFFVSKVNVSYLDSRHPCFGEVVSGKDVVDRICAAVVDSVGKPRDVIRIQRVRIAKVGDPPPLPEPVPFTPASPKLGLGGP